MRKLFLTVFLVFLAAIACAENPFGVIQGGSGTTLTTGSVTSAHIADNAIKNVDVASDAGIDGSKMLDNSIAVGKLNFSAGTGDVVGPASATDGGIALYDNTTGKLLKDSTYTITAAGAALLDDAAASNQRTTLGLGTIATQASDNVLITGGKIDGVTIGGTTPAAGTFTTLTTTQGAAGGSILLMEGSGSGTDNISIAAPTSVTTSYKIILPAAACASGSSLVSGGDNTYSCVAQAAVNRTKTFPFAIDNVIATDNVLMWRVPVAVTLTRADCYATVDNVVGSLMECATDNVTSCTVLDAWTVTNAVSPFTDSSMTDGAVAAGAWIRWSTTSVGTASLNRLSCTIQYNE